MFLRFSDQGDFKLTIEYSSWQVTCPVPGLTRKNHPLRWAWQTGTRLSAARLGGTADSVPLDSRDNPGSNYVALDLKSEVELSGFAGDETGLT